MRLTLSTRPSLRKAFYNHLGYVFFFFFYLVKVLSSTFYLGNEKQSRAPSKFGGGLRAPFLLFVHISFLVVVSAVGFLNFLPKHGK